MPTLDGTFFEKSVILLCNYDTEGAFGLVMNHPSKTKVKEVLTEEMQDNSAFDVPLLVGGPVQPESFWAVHSSDFSVKETTVLSPKIHLSSAQDILSLLLDLDYDLRWDTTMSNLGFDPLTTAFTQTGLV